MSFGSDFSGVDDIDSSLTFLSGDLPERTALAQSIARRITTQRGGLFYRQDYGDDLRNYISDVISPAIAAKQISAEVRKDQRIVNCVTTITVVGEQWLILINPTANTGDTFTLSISVDKVSVTLLAVDVT